MKKNIVVLFTLFISIIGFSQIQVKVNGNIFNTTADSIYLSQFFGTHYTDILGAKLDKNGDFKLDGKLPYQDFYVLRLGNERINLILRDESDMQIYADGKNINAYSNIVGSEESKAMKEFIMIMESWNQKKNEATQLIQQNPQQEQEIKASLDREYSLFVSNRQAYIAQNPNSPILLPALSTIDPNTDWTTYDMIAKQLQNSLPGSPTVENNYNQYITFKQQKEASDFLASGKVAPDFEEAMADGEMMKLSDLKGNVVLLDFWASWCGPCRQENPNVVALYEKYKKKGFTVMSVSLDQDKARWLGAIEKDKLTWPYHVSDLKGWSSKVAQQYAVRGIPFTVLIDRDGKIIDTKLRGPALEKELIRIFGE